MISEKGFTDKINEFVPDSSKEGLNKLIEYANELDKDDVCPKGEFFSNTLIEFYLVTQQYGKKIAQQLLEICETFTFNPFELRGGQQYIYRMVLHRG